MSREYTEAERMAYDLGRDHGYHHGHSDGLYEGNRRRQEVLEAELRHWQKRHEDLLEHVIKGGMLKPMLPVIFKAEDRTEI